MKLLAFLLITALCIVKVHSFIAQAMGVVALVKEALEIGAPFRDETSKRLEYALWGDKSGRASRSTDVILFNKSEKKFKLVADKCNSGGFSPNLFPEHVIYPKTSSFYGVESHGFMSGVKCTITYKANDGSFFEIKTKNSYFGKNSKKESYSSSLSIYGIFSKGNNNQVRFIIEDA